LDIEVSYKGSNVFIASRSLGSQGTNAREREKCTRLRLSLKMREKNK